MRIPVGPYLVVFSILAVAAYGFWEGTPQDVVNAVRAGDVERFRKAVRRDPAAVHTKVYPQAHERSQARMDHRARTGESAWQGRYLIHDAVQRQIEPIPMLDALAAAGADLKVRLDGQTLLHLAAVDDNAKVAGWLLDHGADVNARNDCAAPCEQRGRTPLHEARFDDTLTLLLARGAAVDAQSADGRTALHDSGVGRALVLCRHGADPSLADAASKTPGQQADGHLAATTGAGEELLQLQQLARWLRPGSGCAIVSAQARRTGQPVPDAEARKVFAQTALSN
ncbi:MAG: ankyrin repeat domain-containing protein [Ottowia sp.]|uniref:ankyrin repeat domain-containing protein n=1 Tax=Ottowia sp. TaxID=1898956 RepID=UPI0039E6A9E7